MKTRLMVWLLLLSSGLQLFADTQADLATRSERYYLNYSLAADGAATQIVEWSIKVLKESALADMKKATISHSTSIETAEVLEAYTQKADGRKLEVPKSNYQLEVNSGRGKDDPVFSDYTTMTVVFPDVAVGDSTVLKYRVVQSQPMFPGHFSTSLDFSRHYAYDDVRISIDAPKGLWLQHEARFMNNVVDQEKDGRRWLEWRYTNPNPDAPKRRNYYPVYNEKQQVGVAISTFRNYQEIAQAYASRAIPKAVPTERVRKLADEITQSVKGVREQAKVLYDWVERKIDYAGNCIGVGAVVPHDLDFVLDNLMGDCKDHATLLQALLSAKGIAATQALVNAGNKYSLPKIPVVQSVNHVLNYLPELDLFLDSTARDTPFALAPAGIAGKPVLLVEGYREDVRIPAIAYGQERQEMKTRVKISPQGNLEVDVKISLKGLAAADMRARMRDLSQDQMLDLVKRYVRSMGFEGDGKFEQDDPQAVSGQYNYSARFSVENYIKRPGPGAFTVSPLFFSAMPVSRYVSGHEKEEPAKAGAEENFYCGNGFSTEEYVFEVPKGMKILALPGDVKVDEGIIVYQSKYQRKGQILTVKRRVEDKTPGPVCGRNVEEIYRRVSAKVTPDLRSQIIFQ